MKSKLLPVLACAKTLDVSLLVDVPDSELSVCVEPPDELPDELPDDPPNELPDEPPVGEMDTSSSPPLIVLVVALVVWAALAVVNEAAALCGSEA